MSTSDASAFEPSDNPLTRLVRSWSWFWFHPASPTPLGLIRIFCGLATFYLTLAYSVDLQEFFGKNAWVDQQLIDHVRHEFPHGAKPWSWDETPKPPPVPARALTEQEKEYERAYAKRWNGANPRTAVANGYPVWSVWFHVTDPTWMVVVHVTILGIIFLFTIGLATRVTSVLTWFGVVSYIQRAPTSLFGVDTMMNILLLYLMIGPSGAALSVDRLIARYWASWRALRGHRPVPDRLEPRPSVSANFTLRLVQVHLCVIYLVAGLAKLKGPAWWQGTAVWKTMANFEFSPVHFSPYLDLLHFLSSNILLWYIVMTGMAVFTLCMEIGFPILIWVRPMRWVMLTMALLMHTGIALFMGLNTFSLFMLVFLLAFVPLETMQKLLGLLGRGSRPLRLSFNGRSRPQVRAASLVRAVDVWDQVALQEQPGARRGSGAADVPRSGPALQTVGTLRPEPAAAEALSLDLTTEDGQTLRGFAVFERLVYSLRLLWPLVPAAWLLGVTGLGRAWFPGTAIPVAVSPSENGKRQGKGEKVPSS